MRDKRFVEWIVAAASVLLLIGTGPGTTGWMVFPAKISPQQVPARAPVQHVSASPSRVRSFVLTATEEIWLANGYPGLRMDTTPVRIQIKLWYASPTRWRIERHYLTPPAQRALLSTFLGSPNVSVRNGSVYWIYDSLRHIATVQRLLPGPSVFPSGPPAVFEVGALGGPLSPTAFEAAGDVRTLLKRLAACDTAGVVPISTPKLVGTGTAASRAAYVVDFGNKPCGWNSASADEDMGRRLLWVDQHTFFLLKLVQYSVFFDRRQFFKRMTVTQLRFNVPLAASRFGFRPPPHTRLVPATPRPVAPATLKPLPDIRRRVSFPVFVPTWVPDGLRFRRATVDGEQHVTMDYNARDKHVSILEGPIGCCLDSDPGKYSAPLALPQGRTAYLLDVGAQYGGLILWWDQQGTYIALSSTSLTEGHLLRIAASMSSTAIA